jgi:hypothetical protein
MVEGGVYRKGGIRWKGCEWRCRNLNRPSREEVARVEVEQAAKGDDDMPFAIGGCDLRNATVRGRLGSKLQ